MGHNRKTARKKETSATKTKAKAKTKTKASELRVMPTSLTIKSPPTIVLPQPAAVRCPVCQAIAPRKYKTSPYWVCPTCNCWFQSPMPPKTFEAAHEKSSDGDFIGHLMSDNDKEVNRRLAGTLFNDWLHKTPAKTLDIGSKYPFLAHCFKELGCEAFGMDNLEIIPEYSRELGIPMLVADFEAISEDQIREWTKTEKFSLITMVHVFEHMYEPLEALRKLRKLLADDGTLFIRLPDHGTPGFERDLTEGHYTIHPFFHCLSSLLELLVQGQDLFTVQQTYPMNGSGQRDLMLRPIARKPVVYAGMIVKNEARDLPRCLQSIESVVDAVVLVDTGSTDDTLEVSQRTIGKPVFTQTYTGASRQDEAGDWKIWNFGKARNAFVEEIERRGADYVLWMDGDDELLTPANLRRAPYWGQFDVFGIRMESGGSLWTHHRLWKTGRGIHYEGRCHEYPTIGAWPSMVLMDTVIRHHAEPGAGENSNARNMRIMLEEFAECPSPRTAFYLANTFKDASRHAEAVPWYEKRIAMGPGFRDEWLFAHLYKARCQRAAGDLDAAKSSLLRAIAEASDWAEFWMELAYLAYHDQKAYQDAIGYAMHAFDKPVPTTQLWREHDKYTDQPARIISWCYEHLGDEDNAYEWAVRARDKIATDDSDWNARITRLGNSTQRRPMRRLNAAAARRGAAMYQRMQQGGFVRTMDCPTQVRRPCIAVCRPGAIGDILMTLNLIPILRRKWPNHDIHYFCAPGIGSELGDLMKAAGVSRVRDSSQFESAVNNFSHYASSSNLIGYPLHEGYPNQPMRSHLLEYFARELGVSCEDALPALEVPLPKRPIEIVDGRRYATLQVQTGWSAYKNWPVERWEEVVRACPDIPIYQIGASSEPRVKGANHTLMGVRLASSIAAVANASLHLGLDSFANHLTNYRWDDDGVMKRVPGLILWGSTQATASGYPHNTNISLGLACQPCFREDPAVSRMPRGPCINPLKQVYAEPRHACMFGIDVARVAREAQALWSAST